MGSKLAAYLVVGLLACLPRTPDIGSEALSTTAEASSEDGWHEIDPPQDGAEEESACAPTGTSWGTSEAGGGEFDEGSTSDGAPQVEARLRLTGAYFDPPGTDGAPQGPEWVELVNLGPDPFPLEFFKLEARSWPQLDAGDLGFTAESAELVPGGRLRVLRYSDVDPGMQAPLFDGADIMVRFEHSSGLRNVDGALRVFALGGAIDDQTCWGTIAQPAPYDDDSLWSGPCVNAPSGSLCRVSSQVDTDSASDWLACD